jgi:hypothetical protein
MAEKQCVEAGEPLRGMKTADEACGATPYARKTSGEKTRGGIF